MAERTLYPEKIVKIVSLKVHRFNFVEKCCNLIIRLIWRICWLYKALDIPNVPALFKYHSVVLLSVHYNSIPIPSDFRLYSYGIRALCVPF